MTEDTQREIGRLYGLYTALKDQLDRHQDEIAGRLSAIEAKLDRLMTREAQTYGRHVAVLWLADWLKIGVGALIGWLAWHRLNK